jgi:flap endonuclease-1
MNINWNNQTNEMGIRHLNKYLREKCPNSIRCVNMADLNGKIIAVDISIYLYKYESEDALLENMYLMLSIFIYYNIIPIFVFDGKPPAEKNALLQQRKENKLNAMTQYEKIKEKLDVDDIDEDEKQEMLITMDHLKKQFIFMNREKIEKVKELIRAYGATYYDAPGEADELCAMLVAKKKAWACMSEDMDLFVYGCPRVLRYFSLSSHNAVLYYMKGILQELHMSQDEFREICVLSGTDYNINANGVNKHEINLEQTLKWFHKYKKSDTSVTFYTWLNNNTDFISDNELLKKINQMFDLRSYNCNLEIFKKVKIINGYIRSDCIEEIMKDDGFIFVS